LEDKIIDTKIANFADYVMLYSGDDFFEQPRYPGIVVLLYMTFLYGPVLPILFPIATIGFFNSWFVTKFGLTYYYREPTLETSEALMDILEHLKWAPLMTIAVLVWIMTSRSNFENDSKSKKYLHKPG
jgi:hypothetical protein